MIGLTTSYDRESFAAKVSRILRRRERNMGPDIEAILNEIGRRTIAKLRSYTGKMRPPVTAGGIDRPARLGGWADITGELEESYDYMIVRGRRGSWALAITNDSGHAIYLDRREGFFVLRGVTARGGIAQQIVRQVVAEYTGQGVRFTDERDDYL